MTITPIVEHASDNRIRVLLPGVAKATDSPEWDERSSNYLLAHPEISAALPSWAEEVYFSLIDDEDEGTVFSYAKMIRNVELYGVGTLRDDVTLDRPEIYIVHSHLAPADPDVLPEWALEIAQDLITAATVLKSEPRLLRRTAAVEAELREREQ